MVREPGQRPDTGGHSGYPGDTQRHGIRETMAETAVSAAEQAKSAATERMEQQKQAASQSIDAFAQAVRRASDELRNQDQTAVAQLIQQAAGGLESLSRSLSSQSLGDMVGTVRDFGRRNPMALAGGAALIGLALGRVARTATDGSNGSEEHAGSSNYARPPVASSPATRASSSTPSVTPSPYPSPASARSQSEPGSQFQSDGKRSGGSS